MFGNGDFITHDFGDRRFDTICSAATIQWIPEEIAFRKTFELLKPGGTLAMMLTMSDYRTPDDALYEAIQKVYSEYFRPEFPYTHGGFRYENTPAYGYTDLERREFHGKRVMTADEYVAFCGTHYDHKMAELDYTQSYAGKSLSPSSLLVVELERQLEFRNVFLK